MIFKKCQLFHIVFLASSSRISRDKLWCVLSIAVQQYCPSPPSYLNAVASPSTGPYPEGTVVTYSITCGGSGVIPGTCPAQCWTGGTPGVGTMTIICQNINLIPIPGQPLQLDWILQQPNPGLSSPPSSLLLPLGPPYCNPGTSGTCKYTLTYVICFILPKPILKNITFHQIDISDCIVQIVGNYLR